MAKVGYEWFYATYHHPARGTIRVRGMLSTDSGQWYLNVGPRLFAVEPGGAYIEALDGTPLAALTPAEVADKLIDRQSTGVRWGKP